MVYPVSLTSPLPSEDMPENCTADFHEARAVLGASPRAAAALLRLCIQRLCVHFGGAGKNINQDIGHLVANGLDKRVQQAMDIVRVTGNNAVHPGTMDLKDNPEVAEKLFQLTNMIVDEMITKPAEIAAIYGELPKGARDAIDKRDASSIPDRGQQE